MISSKAIRKYGELHPDLVPSLSNWLTITRRAKWRTFVELRADFGNADKVGLRTVFNISGNKYRMIARVNYQRQLVFVLKILKHTEYDKGNWK